MPCRTRANRCRGTSGCSSSWFGSSIRSILATRLAELAPHGCRPMSTDVDRCRSIVRGAGVGIAPGHSSIRVDGRHEAALGDGRVRMKYALLIYADEKAMEAVPHDQRHAMYEEYEKFANELVERGVMRGGDQLADSPAATTVRVREGQQLVTDGPFAETKEQLGGYFLVEVDDLDTAIELASKIPGARHGSVEVRPIIEG